ncbi:MULTISPECIES: Na+/H+ antiporter subunit D [Microcella]|uniref:Na+/H+ antiporter subunit D n=1 Tax=Microcella pacifica TaxID=2591847 RepID=A0A9E5JSP2_9MICO|nr:MULTISPECIES: Na+/H+ antiporter subunit D [Microcella]MBU1250697.1 Na+/H+ antiporter subunit D [Actinomycetota bacterium]MBU1607895.1 Na+/H+ antiporter subunit D [Actinomycetota bacterium]MBU2316071.1 Na+/H+ antiporter subunit D [Actinomycetota bacterium]MBU2386020.1 Na+/H+ antiporter subunit D [Actinomycetota bacterium]NHF61753.1 Na+/H+ antiporter subunit D [Microcella pacifica]
MTALVPLVVLVPLLGAAVTLALGFRPQAQRIVAIVALVIELGLGIALLIAVDAGGPLAMELGGWSAPFGIVLVVDRLSAVMVLVSALVLLAVLLFSVGQGIADGDEETPVSIYNPTYLILTTGVMVAFVSGDLFNLYVGFEILLVASYVLITLGGTEARIRAGVTYVIVSLLSSLLFLASIAMVYGALGTVNLAQVAARMQDLPADVQVLLHVMLLVAFGIKAAVFPLSFWLPDSYPSAPAPVTAAFAGLLTKIGVYAIIRVETVIFPGPELNPALMVVALLTMVVGALGAVAQADIKRILSFTLVSHIGYMILGVALGTAAGTAAAIYYIAHHIVIQTTLFLAAGLVEREAGSTSITRIGGLLASAPLVAVLFFVPALNLGGIPPFSGFIGKLGLFQAAAEQGDALAYVLIGAGALVSLLTLYALVRVWNLAFWRPAGEVEGDETRLLRTVEEAPHSTTTIAATRATSRLMTVSTVLMVVVGIALTVFAGPLYGLADRAADNLDGPEQYIQIVFPQGVEP